ncbi:putative LPS assembly protein LptD [Emticicia sp. SJ17W-69]|uniref:putative LPS assembly protein LptD n=1 Tax=Emticicia sp. SJ17W-69 TaxID=3421657 RepID=UPI003EB81F8E
MSNWLLAFSFLKLHQKLGVIFKKNHIRAFLLAFSMLFFSLNIFAQFPSGGRLPNFGSGSSTQRPTSTNNSRTTRPFGNKLFEEKKDTTRVLIPDSLRSKNSGLEATVNYIAEDSTVMDVTGKIVNLYGKAKITYADIVLEADYIRLDWGKSEVFAYGSPDSTKNGTKVKGKPVFSQSGEKYNTDTIRYNFKSRKAIIKGIVTQQGEGFVTGQKVKKDANDDLYLVDAKYTTCNLAEPHFHIAAKKIKLVNKKQVISGPFNLVLNNIPLPIGLPFGFFPIPKKKEAGTSGILMGTYGEDANQRGFYLQNFGYYFAINEKIGLQLTTQLYSKGSWGVGLQSNYSKRYKYSGNLNFQFNYNKLKPEVVSPEDKNTYVTKDFSLSWSHSPANKRPDRSFSSSVNLRSNGFNKNNVNTVDVKNYLSSTSNSSVQFGRTFAQKLVTSSGVNVSQNFTTGQTDASLNYSIGLNQFNPFVPEKKQIGRWYESFRVGLNVSGGYQATNTKVNSITNYSEYKIVRQNNDGSYSSIEAKPLTNEEIKLRDANPLTLTVEQRVAQKALQERLSNVRKLNSLTALNDVLKDGQFQTTYSIPISLPNFKIARYINFTPSISLRGDIATKRLNYEYIESENAVKIDTVSGFFPTYQTSVSGSMNTRVYGTYQFKGKGRLQAIRHTMAPSLSLSYAPDFTKNLFQYSVIRVDKSTDANGKVSYDTLRKLLPRYPKLGASAGASGNISFNLTNQLEAKVRSKSDTAAKAFEKISLLDNLSLGTSYNLLALGDSMNLSNINLGANTNLFKNLINLNFGATLDPYFYQEESTEALRLQNPAGRIRRFYKIQEVKGFSGLATLRSANIAIATRLSPATFNKEKPKPKSNPNADPTLEAMKKFVAANPELYVDFTIPWTLSLGYNFNYNKQGLAKAQITQAITVQGDLSLTPKWKVGFSTGYDLQLKAPTLTNITLHRELHCWDMAFNWTPISGYSANSSYSFTLNVRSALLQELKVSRRRQYYGSGGF